jgi:hypothetical protein
MRRSSRDPPWAPPNASPLTLPLTLVPLQQTGTFAWWWGHSCRKWGSRGLLLQVWQGIWRFGAFLRPYLQQKAPTALVTQGMAIFWGKAGRKWRGSGVRAGSVCAGVCGPEGASAKGITPVFSKPFRPWKDRSRHERRLPEAHTPPCTLNLQCQIIAESR